MPFGGKALTSDWSSGTLIFYEAAGSMTAGYEVLQIGTGGVVVGDGTNDVDFTTYGTGSKSFVVDYGAATIKTNMPILPTTSDAAALGSATLMWSDLFLASGAVINFNNGNVTITHAAATLAFAGATAAGVNGYSFDMAVGAIASEAHGVDVAATGTLASGKSLVGLNVVATAAGTAGSWLSGGYIKAVQGSKMVNGYICGLEVELASTAANSSDNAVLVLNSTSTLTGSPPAAIPYIMCREYGNASSYANAFVRLYDATPGSKSDSVIFTSVGTTNSKFAVRMMVGTTPYWLLATDVAPSAT